MCTRCPFGVVPAALPSVHRRAIAAADRIARHGRSTFFPRRAAMISTWPDPCVRAGHEATFRPRHPPDHRCSRRPRPRRGPGSSLGRSGPYSSDAGQPTPCPQELARQPRREVPGHSPSPPAGAGSLVGGRPSRLPGGRAVGLGAGAPPRCHRPPDRQRQDPRRACRREADTAGRSVPCSDTSPPRAMASRDRRRLPGRGRVLRRRRAPAGAADGRHLRERIPAHARARGSLRAPDRRRGPPLRRRLPR